MDNQSNPSNDDASKEETIIETTEVENKESNLVKKEETLPSRNTNKISKSVASSFDLSYSSSLESTVKDLVAFNQLAPYYVDSSLCKHRSINDFVVAAIAGKELKLSLTQSINNIVSIQGNATLPVNLIKALLIRENIIFELVEDYVPLYNHYRIDKDNNFVKTQKGPILAGIGSIKEEFIKSKADSTTVVDFRSTYLFTRLRKIGKLEKLVEVKGSFTWLDAVQMGLSTKDNYIKQPKTMIKARAFSNGAREIAPDIMLGMYSDVEMSDSTNTDYTYDDSIDAEAVVIED